MNTLLGKHILAKGFSVVELIIVTVVIGILVAVSVVGYNGVTQRALNNSLLSDIETLASIQTIYALKEETGGKSWYSPSGDDPDLRFTPSDPNTIIDVVVTSTDYCIRAFNPSSEYPDITTAALGESSPGVCATLVPSLAAGGVLLAPANLQASYNGTTYGIDITWNEVPQASSYNLEYTNATYSINQTITGITTESATINNAVPNGYDVRVYSVSGAVVSEPSPIVSVPVLVSPP